MSTTAVAATPAQTQAKPAVRVLPVCAAIAYALAVTAMVLRHEPWADEAQAWLLARDASLSQIWLKLMHYEGSPGLWQTLLHVLVKSGLPYSAYNFVSAAFALGGVWMLVRYAPLPPAIRFVLPFTYYLFYQYAVVARSYALLAPLLFAVALLFEKARARAFLFTTLLCLMAGISVHGVVISASIWLVAFFPALPGWKKLTREERRRIAAATAMYALVLIACVLCAWPANDVAFAEHRGLSNFHYLPAVAEGTIGAAFTGEWISSTAVIALSMPFLWAGGGWLVFLLPTVILLLFGTLVYAQVWHFGIFFLIWLFALWISALRVKISKPAIAALAITIGCQLYWTVTAAYYDWDQRYSGSLEAAQYLRGAEIPPDRLYAIGYSTTAIQPYFPRNLYSDFDSGGPAAYWDWSKRNTANDPSALFASGHRDFVLVGYKSPEEKTRWAKLLNLLGYQQTRQFEGKTFWQTATFESESFDLYRSDPSAAQHATSHLSMADTSNAAQLLTGFYAVEAQAWRWAAKNFSVLLRSPSGSVANGAQLTMRMYLPPVQLQTLGPITLSANLNGYQLPARTFTAPGGYVYSADIPAKLLRNPLVTANFSLDKAVANMKTDPRELGTVVTEIALEPRAQP
ncbi:MAG TPA: hypothetical protein VKX49_13205 [Bryobacteraceae bacterium]|nr:hypothetical protein [Bryobacteraceae bacterium]